MEYTEIIQSVENFYNSAWEKLIITGTVVFAVVGVFVPFIIQWWQRRSLSIQESALEQKLIKYTTELKEEIRAEIEAELQEKHLLEIRDLRKEILNVDAGVFHIQANQSLSQKNYSQAVVDYYHAANSYVDGEDFFNLMRILSVGFTSTLKKISPQDFQDIVSSRGDLLKEIIDKVRKVDEKRVFADVLMDLESSHRKLISAQD